MRKEQPEHLDPNQPALVVTFGNTSRKHRPLESDTLVLGRNPNCDISLVSPEVMPVHCVLTRTARGWLIRDCSGRPGTRVNGRAVHETLLDNGDIIQVGTFSFEAHLPEGHGPDRSAGDGVPAAGRLARLERSRRNLARQALRLRERLAEQAASGPGVPPEMPDPDALKLLRAEQREHELRAKRLGLAERDLATDRATLDQEFQALKREAEKHQAVVEQFEAAAARKEKELAALQKALEAEKRERREKGKRRATAAETVSDANIDLQNAVQQSREVEVRARELDHYAEYLRRLHKALNEGSALPPPPPGTEAPVAVPVKSAVPDLSDHKALLARAEATFRKQQEELDRLISAARKLHQSANGQSPEDAKRIEQEKQALAERVAALERKLKEYARAVKQREEAVRSLKESERTTQDQLTALKGEADNLRREVAAKNAQLARLKESRKEAGGVEDVDSYEAELNRYRQQLEADRGALDEEIRHLRTRSEELEAAAREAELQLSRERAQMARERVELNRMRDELRLQSSDRRREQNIRDRLTASKGKQKAVK